MAKDPIDIEVIREVIRVMELEGKSLLSCVERIRAGSSGPGIARAVRLFKESLDRGGKIIVTGIGKSGKVGQKIAATLSSTGSLAVFLHPTEGLHGDLGVIAPNDAVLALSYTGNTEELVKLLPSFKSLRVPVVGLGGNPASRLAQQCDAWIDGAVEQEACPHNLAPTSSTTLALALGDAIAVALMQLRGFDARAFAKFHPGGALGNRLNLRVADLMHGGERLPRVSGDASMDEVVVVSTRHKLGAVIVARGSRMEGIITDGDIRRALQFREKFFSMKASEVMTRNPVSVGPDAMAKDALAIMENRPSQISVLPVVDADGNIQGVLRLHDLVQTL